MTDKESHNKWKKILPKKTKPFIGIVWRGKDTVKARSIPLDNFYSLIYFI